MVLFEIFMPEIQTHQTAQEQGSENVFSSLGLNGQLFGFQLINFALVLGVVWFLILKPLTKKMTERQDLIDASLQKAKEIENRFAASQKDQAQTIATTKV